MRRGLIADLDESKLVAGEIVMSTDTDFVGIAKGPNDVLELAKKGDVPGAEEMTYAEYQALTPAQKNDGTVRYVEDYPSAVTGATIHYGTTDIGVGSSLPTGDIYIVYE